MTKKCLKCGNKFITYPSRIKIGKGKYCSKICSDLVTLIKKGNIPWIKGKHLRLSIETEFKKCSIPWNKGKHPKYVQEEKHHNWRGDKVGYVALHTWVSRHLGKPKECEICGTLQAKKYEWANRSRQYKRIMEDWIRLCSSCHQISDYYRLSL